MRILFDSFKSEYKTPFGPLREGERCSLSILLPQELCVFDAQLRIETEARETAALQALHREGEPREGYESWRVEISLAAPGLFFYCFRITARTGPFDLFREGLHETNMEAGERWQLSCLPRGFAPPAWAAGQVMYQIFPDRFAFDRILPAEGKLAPYTLHARTDETPEWRPDPATGKITNSDFFGGNLAGITEKLDYLADLGVSVLYLNPIFRAWSNHRYDTADYRRIDELLGTEADFTALCDAAHARGMRVLLDGVFSHTGSRSVYFDERGEFGTGALSDTASPYRSWYQFRRFPDDYEAWWGVKTLPCVRELDPGFLEYIVTGEDSVVAHWLRAGADGFRLDVADELPDEFIRALRRRLKEVKPDALLLGEVWEDASNKHSYGVQRTYFTAGELDSVMNYPFRTAILDYVSGRDGGAAFRDTVLRITENYPQEVLACVMNLLSTHDTARVLSALGPDPGEGREARAHFRMSDSSRARALARVRLAMALQFTLPGMPSVYYGDEIAMEGFGDPFCRGFFDWTRAEREPLREFVRTLAHLRRENPALCTGSLEIETDEWGYLALVRRTEGQTLRAAFCTDRTAELCAGGRVLFSCGTENCDGRLHFSPFSFAILSEE